MAGLTKAQRAEREASHDAAAPVEVPVHDGLVAVAKDGATLRVHPTCLRAHVLKGWKEVAC